MPATFYSPGLHRGVKMALDLEELDDETREHMLREFEAEWATTDKYIPKSLSAEGLSAWPGLMTTAISTGDDESLRVALTANTHYFEPRIQTGTGSKVQNIPQAAALLAQSEFNTYYIRGLSAKLLAESVDRAEVYRAAEPTMSKAACSTHEGTEVSVQDVYDGHRAKYHPVQAPGAFSVPFQPGCHHSIRRVTPPAP